MEIDGEKWEVINFPAIASEKNRMPNDPRDPGEPLWEFKYNKKRLDVIKKQVGSRVWSSLYQQSPTIEGGNIVKEEWFQYYQTLPFDINNWRECYVVNSWDVNFKQSGKSYNVGVAIAKHKADYYFIDMWRRRCGIIQTMKGIAQLNAKFPCKAVLIEEKANGSAILQLMKKRISSLIPIEPGTSKDERLESIAPIIEAGNFHLPANSPLSKLVIEEMTSFPNADNDDIVDAISQALNRFMELKGLRHLMAATKW
jgi:predicted phage terminase large subunit-like protein